MSSFQVPNRPVFTTILTSKQNNNEDNEIFHAAGSGAAE
jgi:hypothetical protein